MIGSTTNIGWPNRTALLVGSDNISLKLFQDLLINMGWQTSTIMQSPQAILEALRQYSYACCVVVDSNRLPAHEVVRGVCKTPKGRLTPIFLYQAFLTEAEQLAYDKVLGVHTLHGPLNPFSFISAFNQMIHAWQVPAMGALRKLAILVGSQIDQSKVIDALSKLANDQKAFIFAFQAKINLLVQLNGFKEAERCLLDELRAQPNSPAILLTCAYFYLDALLPFHALKFLNKLRGLTAGSTIFNLDIAAANLAMGHISAAIEALSEWHKKRPGSELIESYLARLLVAEGIHQDADQYGITREFAQRIKSLWIEVDSTKTTTKLLPLNGNAAS